MASTERALEQVGTYAQTHLFEWLPAPVLQLSERIIRVEEELKAQRELMKQGFEQVDKRFDDFNRRFSGMMWLIGTGFVVLSTLMNLYAFFAKQNRRVLRCPQTGTRLAPHATSVNRLTGRIR